jgi:hypothetical protein
MSRAVTRRVRRAVCPTSTIGAAYDRRLDDRNM